MKNIIVICLLIFLVNDVAAENKIYVSATSMPSLLHDYKKENASDVLAPDAERTYQGINVAGIGLMIGGVGMAAAGVSKILATYSSRGERVGKTMLAAGGIMVATGLVMHTFAQFKLEYASVTMQGNSLALTIPRTNKHFGM